MDSSSTDFSAIPCLGIWGVFPGICIKKHHPRVNLAALRRQATLMAKRAIGNAQRKADRFEMRAENRCSCGEPSTTGMRSCPDCRDARRQRLLSRNTEGIGGAI